jgi:hypothetical protein
MPDRVQLSRRRGWRKPENTVVVARPSGWGNPYRVGVGAHPISRAEAVDMFRTLVTQGKFSEEFRQQVRRELAGKNLACWCPLDQPCHADVLLELANGAME